MVFGLLGASLVFMVVMFYGMATLRNAFVIVGFCGSGISLLISLISFAVGVDRAAAACFEDYRFVRVHGYWHQLIDDQGHGVRCEKEGSR